MKKFFFALVITIAVCSCNSGEYPDRVPPTDSTTHTTDTTVTPWDTTVVTPK